VIMQNGKVKPVIMIGATRSGTNMLRDAMVKSSALATWPCDEINAIWRHGNMACPSDQFTAEQASPRIKRFIRKQFEKLAETENTPHVLEKTCANSMRVPFVDAIFPEAKYIFLVRHGFDASISGAVRWQAKFNLEYTLKKLRYVPLVDIPLYGSRYLKIRAQRLLSGEKTLSSWGPIYEGMLEDRKEMPLLDVCVRQWRACVENSSNAFTKMAPGKVLQIRYEDLVTDSEATLSRILSFCDVEVNKERMAAEARKFRADGVGGWRKKISPETARHLNQIVGETLSTFGYEYD
jgi:Sulfotransferase family